MKTKIAKQATYWLSIVAIGLVVGLSIQFVQAWTEPSVAPPGGNVGAPINTSATAQTKSGILTVNPANFLVPSGNSGFGTASPSYRVDILGSMRLQPTSAPSGSNGVMYYDSATNKFRCYQNGAWVDCIGSGGGGVTSVTGSNGVTASPTTGAVGVSLTYSSKSCSAGYAIQSFNLGSSSAPTCVAVGGGVGDNLGNHTATQNLIMSNYQIMGGSDGRTVALNAGNVIKLDWSPESVTGAYTTRFLVDSTDFSLQRRPGTGGNIQCPAGQAIQIIGADGGTSCVPAGGVTSGTSVYSCPSSGRTFCWASATDEGAITCRGQIQLGATCTDAGVGLSCTTIGCSLVGKLIAP